MYLRNIRCLSLLLISSLPVLVNAAQVITSEMPQRLPAASMIGQAIPISYKFTNLSEDDIEISITNLPPQFQQLSSNCTIVPAHKGSCTLTGNFIALSDGTYSIQPKINYYGRSWNLPLQTTVATPSPTPIPVLPTGQLIVASSSTQIMSARSGTSTEGTLTLENVANHQAITINSVTVPTATEGTLTTLNDECTSRTIIGNTECTVSFRYTAPQQDSGNRIVTDPIQIQISANSGEQTQTATQTITLLHADSNAILQIPQETTGFNGFIGNPTAFTSVTQNGATTLYTATDTNGVYRSTDNGQTWSSFNEGIVNQSVTALISDATGTLYAGTTDSNTNLYERAPGATVWTPIVAFPYSVSALTLDAQQNLYAGTPTNGLWQITNPNHNLNQIGNLQGAALDVTAINFDKTNNLYIGTHGAGVWKIVPTNSYNNDATQVGDLTGAASNVNALVVDQNNVVYIGTNGAGLLNYNTNWTAIPGLTQSAINVQTLMFGAQNQLYIGTSSGVYALNSEANNLAAPYVGLQASFINALYIDPNGTLYAASALQGLYTLAIGTTQWVSESAWLNNNVGALLVSDNKLYAGTSNLNPSDGYPFDNSVFQVDVTDLSQWQRLAGGLESSSITALSMNQQVVYAGVTGVNSASIYALPLSNPQWQMLGQGLHGAALKSMFIDNQGAAYAGTYYSDSFFSLIDRVWQNSSSNSQPVGYITDFEEDNNGTLYLGVKSNGATADGGVYYNTNPQDLDQPFAELGNNISTMQINSLIKDTNDLYAATQYQNNPDQDQVFRWSLSNDKTNGSWETLGNWSNNQGNVPSNTQQLIIDKEGNMYLITSYARCLNQSCPGGIWKYTAPGSDATQAWQPISLQGIATQSISSAAFDATGNLYLGTRNGVYQVAAQSLGIYVAPQPSTSGKKNKKGCKFLCLNLGKLFK